MNEQAKTNADLIRAMTDEERAEEASRMTFCDACPVPDCDALLSLDQCRDAWLAWLRSPVEDGEE